MLDKDELEIAGLDGSGPLEHGRERRAQRRCRRDLGLRVGREVTLDVDDEEHDGGHGRWSKAGRLDLCGGRWWSGRFASASAVSDHLQVFFRPPSGHLERSFLEPVSALLADVGQICAERSRAHDAGSWSKPAALTRRRCLQP